MEETLLEVRDLRTWFFTGGTIVRAVDGLSYTVKKGECAAIIGESGSGKSVGALSLLRLVPFPPGKIMGGQVIYKGEDLLSCSEERIRSIRGREISMIFQEPSAALNPVMTIGAQIVENIMLHNGVSDENLTVEERTRWQGVPLRQRAMDRAKELLSLVDIPNPTARIKDYPFQFSGGMQQRAMIAMAMSCNPKLLIADEPTTALDVTVQAQVLERLNSLRARFGTALIIITHNLGVVARYASSVKIMYGGSIVEEGSPQDIFEHPLHPYTLGLIRAVPRLDLPRSHGLHTIEGEPPNMALIPPNCCPFHFRCRYADEQCRSHRPELQAQSDHHRCACFHADQTGAERQEVCGI